MSLSSLAPVVDLASSFTLTVDLAPSSSPTVDRPPSSSPTFDLAPSSPMVDLCSSTSSQPVDQAEVVADLVMEGLDHITVMIDQDAARADQVTVS